MIIIMLLLLLLFVVLQYRSELNAKIIIIAGTRYFLCLFFLC